MNILHRVPGASKPRVNSPSFVAWSMKHGAERTAKLVRALVIASKEGRILF